MKEDLLSFEENCIWYTMQFHESLVCQLLVGLCQVQLPHLNLANDPTRQVRKAMEGASKDTYQRLIQLAGQWGRRGSEQALTHFTKASSSWEMSFKLECDAGGCYGPFGSFPRGKWTHSRAQEVFIVTIHSKDTQPSWCHLHSESRGRSAATEECFPHWSEKHLYELI